jgi:hypothetical protein
VHAQAEQLTCRRRCHDAHTLYLVDAGSGGIDLHGWSYGIAVGDGRPRWLMRAATPRLAQVTQHEA